MINIGKYINNNHYFHFKIANQDFKLVAPLTLYGKSVMVFVGRTKEDGQLFLGFKTTLDSDCYIILPTNYTIIEMYYDRHISTKTLIRSATRLYLVEDLCEETLVDLGNGYYEKSPRYEVIEILNMYLIEKGQPYYEYIPEDDYYLTNPVIHLADVLNAIERS